MGSTAKSDLVQLIVVKLNVPKFVMFNFIIPRIMELEFVPDLYILIFNKKHEYLEAVAELHVVKDKAVTLKEECDLLAKQIKGGDQSVSETLVETWAKYKFFMEREEILKDKVISVGVELGQLQHYKLHMEQFHPSQD